MVALCISVVQELLWLLVMSLQGTAARRFGLFYDLNNTQLLVKVNIPNASRTTTATYLPKYDRTFTPTMIVDEEQHPFSSIFSNPNNVMPTLPSGNSQIIENPWGCIFDRLNNVTIEAQHLMHQIQYLQSKQQQQINYQNQNIQLQPLQTDLIKSCIPNGTLFQTQLSPTGHASSFVIDYFRDASSPMLSTPMLTDNPLYEKWYTSRHNPSSTTTSNKSLLPPTTTNGSTYLVHSPTQTSEIHFYNLVPALSLFSPTRETTTNAFLKPNTEAEESIKSRSRTYNYYNSYQYRNYGGGTVYGSQLKPVVDGLNLNYESESLRNWNKSEIGINDQSPCAQKVELETAICNHNPIKGCLRMRRTVGPPLKSYMYDDVHPVSYGAAKTGNTWNGHVSIVANLPDRMNGFPPNSYGKQSSRMKISTDAEKPKELGNVLKLNSVSWDCDNEKFSLNKQDSKHKVIPTYSIQQNNTQQKQVLLRDTVDVEPSVKRASNLSTATFLHQDDSQPVESLFRAGIKTPSYFYSEALPTKSGILFLTKPGYYSIPNVKDLKVKDSVTNKTCFVEDFRVGHIQHGNVVFHGWTDVFGLDLDQIIKFSKKAIEIYQDPVKKPPFGQGLHRPCTVTLQNIWPVNASSNSDVNHARIPESAGIQVSGFENLLRETCQEFGGTFLNYSSLLGEWKFRVQEGLSTNGT